MSQQLTEKSDVYSFGVVLLELISGQQAISNERFGVNSRNIVPWVRVLISSISEEHYLVDELRGQARAHIESGNIQGIIDPGMAQYSVQSVWKIAEQAMMCVRPQSSLRPAMSAILREIREALAIEREEGSGDDGDIDISTSPHVRNPPPSGTDVSSFSESVLLPSAR